MTQGFQNQAAGIQIETSTLNTGTINGDITTQVTSQKRIQTSKPDMKKRAKAMMYASTAQIGASLKTFGERLTSLNEPSQDDEMNGVHCNTNNTNNNNNMTVVNDSRSNNPCNRQEKNKNV